MRTNLYAVAALALGACVAGPARASTTTLVYSVSPSTLTANDSNISYIGDVSENGKAFADYWEFVVPAGGLDISITAQDTVTKASQLLSSGTTLSLYLCSSNCSKGTTGGNSTPGAVPVPNGLQAVDLHPLDVATAQYWDLGSLASLLPVTGGDSYFIELAGTAGTGSSIKLGITGNIATATVPEPATWVMMAIGFVGVGLPSLKRGRKLDRFLPV